MYYKKYLIKSVNLILIYLTIDVRSKYLTYNKCSMVIFHQYLISNVSSIEYLFKKYGHYKNGAISNDIEII